MVFIIKTDGKAQQVRDPAHLAPEEASRVCDGIREGAEVRVSPGGEVRHVRGWWQRTSVLVEQGGDFIAFTPADFHRAFKMAPSHTGALRVAREGQYTCALMASGDVTYIPPDRRAGWKRRLHTCWLWMTGQ